MGKRPQPVGRWSCHIYSPITVCIKSGCWKRSLLSSLLDEHKDKFKHDTPSRETETLRSKLLTSFLLFACYGIPPDYNLRFKAARKRYESTFQPETWESFIVQLVNERSNMNIVVCIYSAFLCHQYRALYDRLVYYWGSTTVDSIPILNLLVGELALPSHLLQHRILSTLSNVSRLRVLASHLCASPSVLIPRPIRL